MSDISDARRGAMSQALLYIAEVRHRTMSVWMTDRFFADVDWTLVEKLCTLGEPWDLTVSLFYHLFIYLFIYSLYLFIHIVQLLF